LASINEIYYPPHKEREVKRDPAPNDPKYESFYIQRLSKNPANR